MIPILIAAAPVLYQLKSILIDASVTQINATASSIYFQQPSFSSELLSVVPLSASIISPTVVLIIFQSRLAKWLVPILPVICPACGNELQHLVQPRCPE